MRTVNGFTKTKILGYFSKHSLDDLYLDTFAREVGYRKSNYADLDILNFLCDYLEEIIVSEKQSYNLVQKIVLSIYGIFAQLYMDKKIDSENIVYDKVLNTEAAFYSYAEKNKQTKDAYVTKFIENVKKLIISTEEKKEKLDEKTKEEVIEEKKEKIEIVKEEKTINIPDEENVSKIVKELEKKITKLTKEAEKYKNKTEEKREQIKELNREIKKLHEQIKELEKEKTKEEKENTRLTKEIEKLLEKIEKLGNLVNELKEKNDENKTQISSILSSDEYKIGKRKLYEEKMDDDILKLIFDKECSMYEINEFYPDYSYEEIQESLARISRNYKIESQDIVIPKRFKVQKIYPESYKKISLRANSLKSLDLMFISDLHIEEENLDSVSKRLDKVYDYCTLKGINTVINLGDFINQEFNDLTKYEQNKKIITLLDDVAKKMPESPSINHIILGGNHDDRILYYGLDPLKYISIRRDDVVNLGYYHALLELSYKDAYDHILLHHKGVPSENYNYSDDEEILKALASNVRSKDTKGNPYMQLFGHLHRARIDVQKEYAIVPSLIRSDEYEAGALHTKVYFADNGNISNILFMPLVYKDGLVKTAEIPYIKSKKYK